MRKISVKDGEFVLSDRVAGLFEKRVTKFGNGAKIDCPKEYLGKMVYVLVRMVEGEGEEKGR
jgi:putative transposon-encoded protein